MLFSHPEVSSLIRERFVAAWETMRPVPRVSIDFGNGHRLERTLRGNIATYICDPEGRVIDVVAGLYDPQTYQSRLLDALVLYGLSSGSGSPERARTEHAARLARGIPAVTPALDVSKVRLENRTIPNVAGNSGRPAPAPRVDGAKSIGVGELQMFQAVGLAEPEPSLAQLLNLQAAALTGAQDRRAPAERPRRPSSTTVASPDGIAGVPLPGMDLSKAPVERRAIRAAGLAEHAPARATAAPSIAAEDLQYLRNDAAANERTRRPRVEGILAESTWTVRAIEKRIFREVLEADLDDPYLGLAQGPFGGGAFDDLDRVAPDALRTRR